MSVPLPLPGQGPPLLPLVVPLAAALPPAVIALCGWLVVQSVTQVADGLALVGTRVFEEKVSFAVGEIARDATGGWVWGRRGGRGEDEKKRKK